MSESALVSAAWLEDHLADPGLAVVDASWAMPGVEPNGLGLFRAGHIPGAVWFDIDAIADRSSPYPHMLPSPGQFADAVSALGVSGGDLVVVYDATGVASAAARLWWMFRVFGHDRVRVLDGGLPAWLRNGRSVDSGPPLRPRSGRFSARFRSDIVRALDAVAAASSDRQALILDARAAGRFAGTAPEPWAGGRRGHIPGARSLPFAELLNPDGSMRSPPALAARLEASGLDARPVIASCGSGVTACVIALALHEIGRTDAAVYDGSWAEWGSHPELPAATAEDFGR